MRGRCRFLEDKVAEINGPRVEAIARALESVAIMRGATYTIHGVEAFLRELEARGYEVVKSNAVFKRGEPKASPSRGTQS